MTLHMRYFAVLLMLCSAHAHLGVRVGTAQRRAIPDSIVKEFAVAGSFSYFMVDSVSKYAFLKDTGFSISLFVPNDFIESFAMSPSAQLDDWVAREVSVPLHQGYNITDVVLGENPLSRETGQRFYDSLPSALENLAGKVAPLGVRVSFSIQMLDLKASYPPSAGSFADVLRVPLIASLSAVPSLVLNANPFELAASNSDPATVAFLDMSDTASGFYDNEGKLYYPDILSSSLDAAVYALEELGFPDTSLQLMTGWPTDGAYYATRQLAATYVDGVNQWAYAANGTPKRPFSTVKTYLRSLVDEDLRPIDTEPWQRRWGLYDTYGKYKLNTSTLYYHKLSGDEYIQRPAKYCVVRSDAADQALISGIAYACEQADCTSIQVNSSCYDPFSLRMHATIVFNEYYQDAEQETSTCDFGATASVANSIPYALSPECEVRRSLVFQSRATKALSKRILEIICAALLATCVLI